jgi:hypothetical protein
MMGLRTRGVNARFHGATNGDHRAMKSIMKTCGNTKYDPEGIRPGAALSGEAEKRRRATNVSRVRKDEEVQ